MEKKIYLAPEIEVIEVHVENGFAQSGKPLDEGVPKFGPEIPW